MFLPVLRVLVAAILGAALIGFGANPASSKSEAATENSWTVRDVSIEERTITDDLGSTVIVEVASYTKTTYTLQAVESGATALSTCTKTYDLAKPYLVNGNMGEKFARGWAKGTVSSGCEEGTGYQHRLWWAWNHSWTRDFHVAPGQSKTSTHSKQCTSSTSATWNNRVIVGWGSNTLSATLGCRT
jgi:hypothetical protein